MTFVSVVIPTKNSEKTLNECLKSLKNQDYPKNKYEIIIADDHSKDDTLKIAKKYKVKIVTSDWPPGRQRNKAISAAKGDLIGFIDSDCIAKSDWISKGIKYFDSDEIAIVGGPNLTPKSDSFISHCIGYVSSSKIATGSMSARYTKDGFGFKEADETSLISCNMFARKDTIKKAGGFNTEIFPNEENELMARIKEMDYTFLYIPDLIVWHHRRSTVKGFFLQNLAYGRSRMELIKKHPSALKPFHPFPSIFVLSLIFGSIMYLFYPAIRMFFLGMLALYFLIIFSVGIQRSLKYKNVKIIVMVPILFIALHISYGIGFMFGLVSRKNEDIDSDSDLQ